MGFMENFKYPINVVIYEERKDGVVKKYDKAQRIKKGNVYVFRLKKGKTIIKPQRNEDVFSIGKDNFLILYSDNAKRYHPVDIVKGKIVPRDENWDYWARYMDEQTKFKYFREKGLEVFLPYIMIFVTAFGITAILWVALPFVSQVVAGSLGDLTTAVNNNNALLQTLIDAGGSITQNTPPPY